MRVKISTLQSTDYLPGDYLRLLWDRGDGGELETLVEKIAVFPNQELGPIFSQRIFGAGTFCGGAKSDCTFANRTYAAGSFATPMGSVELLNREIRRAGLYHFAIQAFDFLCNATASGQWKTFNVWVCEEPTPPASLKGQSYDQTTNTFVFGFIPSRSLRRN
jgi:hypothetical protein